MSKIALSFESSELGEIVVALHNQIIGIEDILTLVTREDVPKLYGRLKSLKELHFRLMKIYNKH